MTSGLVQQPEETPIITGQQHNKQQQVAADKDRLSCQLITHVNCQSGREQGTLDNNTCGRAQCNVDIINYDTTENIWKLLQAPSVPVSTRKSAETVLDPCGAKATRAQHV